MACTTFHCFTQLPTELRLIIWEEACLEPRRGHRQGYRAIHYMTVYQSSVHPLSRDSDNSKPRDKSAYLWHAGLWTACRESRGVVASHDMDQVRPREEEEDGEDGPAALVLFPKVRAEHWRQIVCSEDVFCISADNQKASDLDWPCLVDEALEAPPKNVGFELDPSWTVALASRPHNFFIWDNPLAPFELALMSWFIFHWPWDRRVIKIRLIDRDAKWFSGKPGLAPTIFDLDEQFVEIPFSDIHRHLASSSAFSHFLDLIDNVHIHFISRLWRRARQPHFMFNLGDILSILVRWDNRVECRVIEKVSKI
ncbi:hypothetical protein FSPOR_4557 [Fusarium sporotrichioides]|uniref:2EXR domain-containing protein n=1 Tax=Fusarium sporotrichioides TaxID=5514 RepID=A0A395SAM2_FUSSP|nr:hypothetical protein FSPOR_4557 [Fusarium sporotrichioides]